MISGISANSLLKSHFGYDEFRPLQGEVVDHVLSGKDSLVLMPTGGGKSLCYQLPALCFPGITLVISPLIALMKDQVDSLKANGIAAEFINSTLTSEETRRVQLQAQRGQLKILYLAPERLAAHGFWDFLHHINISLIAIDEAHCISEWGHEFRPNYRNLMVLRRDFPHVPVIALTATATEEVRKDILAQLGLERERVFLSSFNRANLNYVVRPKRASFKVLLGFLKKHENGSTIIYCFSRKDTESLAADLNDWGYRALPYHAGLDAALRRKSQEKFIHDEVPIIVATIAFGMGIDKPDVRLVVHYDLPKSLEGYYQETGRAGRDGLPSDCLLFYTYGDKVKQDFFISQMENESERGNARQKLVHMIDYCELHTCRRQFLMTYFGEQWSEPNCGGCDVCVTPKEEFDATEIAQKVLSAVIRTGERFGSSHVVGVLRGAKTKRIVDSGHDRLSVHGIAAESSDESLTEILGLLLAKGLIRKSKGEYPVLEVSEVGRDFLKRREILTLSKPQHIYDVTEGQEGRGKDREIAYDLNLFELLRSWRKTTADRKGLPPYMIFSDTALQEMSYYIPQGLDSFAKISGVGSTKLAEYGDGFVAVIRRHALTNNLTERAIPRRGRQRRSSVSSQSRPSSTYDETQTLFRQQLSIAEIADRRNLKQTSIINHLEHLVAVGQVIDTRHLVPPNRYARIKEAFEATGTFRLTPVLESLGSDYSYEELTLVRLALRQSLQ